LDIKDPDKKGKINVLLDLKKKKEDNKAKDQKTIGIDIFKMNESSEPNGNFFKGKKADESLRSQKKATGKKIKLLPGKLNFSLFRTICMEYLFI